MKSDSISKNDQSRTLRPVPLDRLRQLLRDYLAHLHARACAEGTIRNSALYLGNFLTWLEEQSIRSFRKITRPLLEHYQRDLCAYRKRDGQPLVVMSQHVRLTTIQGFFRWLTRQGYLSANPAADLELPRIGRRLPRAVLTASEAEAVLAQAKPSTSFGLRDRTMLELLYSTGMRRKELCGLLLEDFDLSRGTVLIREGKGKKDRLLPVGRRATRWLQRYLHVARNQLQCGPEHRAVFLGRNGQMITSGVLGNLVHAYVKKSGIGKKGSCHLFRHAMATLMLEGGADIRYIQQMLGHARLTTTEIYTQVNISRLMEIHRHTHPAEQSPPAGLGARTRHRHGRCAFCGHPLPF